MVTDAAGLLQVGCCLQMYIFTCTGVEAGNGCKTGLIRLMNDERRKHNLPELRHDDCLCHVADMHAKDTQRFLDQGANLDDPNHNGHSWTDIIPEVRILVHLLPLITLVIC